MGVIQSRLAYIVLGYLLFPVLIIVTVIKAIKRPEYRRGLSTRFNLGLDKIPKHPIHIHAVSYGEVLSAVELVKQLMERYPETPILFTTMTPTGLDNIRQQLDTSLVIARYLPFDINFLAAHFVAHVQPLVSIYIELELWPNLIHHCQYQGVPVILGNARMNAKSLASYKKYHALSGNMLSKVSLALTQSESDKQALQQLAVQHVEVTGNMKLDAPLDVAKKQQPISIENREHRLVMIAGSTHQQDEQAVLSSYLALKEQFPELLLILAPRKPERFPLVAAQLAQLDLNVALRSDTSDVYQECHVLLLDTLGELSSFYQYADVAFVGGSIANKGGHNPMEAAANCCPIVMGSSTRNCQSMVEQLTAVGGLLIVNQASELTHKLQTLLSNKLIRDAAGMAAYNVLLGNQGAVQRNLSYISKIVEQEMFRRHEGSSLAVNG